MIDILAEIQQNTIPMLIGGGVGGISVGGVACLIIKKQVGKIMDHADNDDIHVRRGNGYITKGVCEAKYEGITQRLSDMQDNLQEILRRLPPN